MPQDDQWNYKDGVVRGGSVCRTDDHAATLDVQTSKVLRNLTSPKVENLKLVAPTCSCGCPHCCA